MAYQRNRRSRPAGKSRDWDDWQRYVRKETQRLMQKSGRQVVPVSFAEPESQPKPKPPQEDVKAAAESQPVDLEEGRRPPVPGVPREEALQVSDDEIGRTVKPFTVDDYRSIRPLTGSDIFSGDEEGSAGAYESVAVEEAAETAVPTKVDTPRVEKLKAAEPEVIEPTVEEEPAKKAKGKKKKGRKKKEREDELELFDSVNEHQTISRQRLTRKSKIVREELIEKLLDPVISLEEAATLIGVCKTTVRRYTNKGELECLRTPGQQRRFKLSQVLEFVKKREAEQKSKGAGKKST
jgi:excisionase family DNA binding protein